MQDLAAILIYGNGRHVLPWGIWGGNSLHLPSDEFQSPTLHRAQLPRSGSPRNLLEVELRLLIIFLGSHVRTLPQAAPGPSPTPSSPNPHSITVPASVLGLGTNVNRLSSSPPSSPLTFHFYPEK